MSRIYGSLRRIDARKIIPSLDKSRNQKFLWKLLSSLFFIDIQLFFHAAYPVSSSTALWRGLWQSSIFNKDETTVLTLKSKTREISLFLPLCQWNCTDQSQSRLGAYLFIVLDIATALFSLQNPLDTYLLQFLPHVASNLFPKPTSAHAATHSIPSETSPVPCFAYKIKPRILHWIKWSRTKLFLQRPDDKYFGFCELYSLRSISSNPLV